MNVCAWCGTDLPKGRRRFCCNQHKDKWHNIHNPRGYFDPNNKLDAQDLLNEINEEQHPLDIYDGVYQGDS